MTYSDIHEVLQQPVQLTMSKGKSLTLNLMRENKSMGVIARALWNECVREHDDSLSLMLTLGGGFAGGEVVHDEIEALLDQLTGIQMRCFLHQLIVNRLFHLSKEERQPNYVDFVLPSIR